MKGNRSRSESVATESNFWKRAKAKQTTNVTTVENNFRIKRTYQGFKKPESAVSKIKVQGVDEEKCKHAGQCYRMNVMSNSKLTGEKENNSTCTPRNGEKHSKLFRKKRRRKEALKNTRTIDLYAHWSGWNWYVIMLVKKVLDKFIPLWSQFNNIHSDFLLVLYKKHLRDTYVSFNLPESRMTSVQLGCHLC